MLHAQQNKYLETAVQTATPAQLLIMLCEGAIRFCRIGIEAIKECRLEEANRNFCKAQAIISEFAITLNKSYQISQDLLKLYDYFVYLIIQANTKKIIEPAEEALGYLVDLKETWIEASKLANASKVVAEHG